MTRRGIMVGAVLVATGLAVSACGGAGAPLPEPVKVAKIGVIAPTTGGLSAMGLGIRNSVELAVDRANASDAIPGWRLEMTVVDEEARPDGLKDAATELVEDENVVGVVGPMDGDTAETILPVLQPAGVAVISPATTGTALTQGPDAKHPRRVHDNFFRTCTTDAVQGRFASRYLLDAGIKDVATIYDSGAYGRSLVDAFSEDFRTNGGRIVTAEAIEPDARDFAGAVQMVKLANPKAVYYGGKYAQAGPLSRQLKGAGLDVPLAGGDGLYDDTYGKLAGPAGDGDLATSVGAPIERLDTAQEFVNAYRQAGYKDGYSAYGAYSYDAANALIEGMKNSLATVDTTADARRGTVQALAAVDFRGATGRVAFDEYGDARSHVVTVYKVVDGRWKADKTADFQ